MFPKIPDMRCAIPGRQPLRHPGLAPGPWLAPGPIKTTRDIKSTASPYSLDPEYRGAISGRRGVGYKIPDIRCAIPGRQPLRLPGLVPGSWLDPGTTGRRVGGNKHYSNTVTSGR